jgi:hypothetical protein
MTFRLIQDYYIVAVAYDFSKVKIVFTEPVVIPIHFHCRKLLEQIDKESVGAGLPMMTVANVGNLQRGIQLSGERNIFPWFLGSGRDLWQGKLQ